MAECWNIMCHLSRDLSFHSPLYIPFLFFAYIFWVNNISQMVEARREGPKPMTTILTIFENKTNHSTKATMQNFSEPGFLALHRASTIPRWSHCYHPIIYRINWWLAYYLSLVFFFNKWFFILQIIWKRKEKEKEKKKEKKKKRKEGIKEFNKSPMQ